MRVIQVWLQNQMQDPAYDMALWVALNDRATEGQYVWTDGSPVDSNVM